MPYIYGQLLNAQLENSSGAPSSGGTPTGRIYVDITTPTAAQAKIYNGTTWVYLFSADVNGNLAVNNVVQGYTTTVTAAGTTTLTVSSTFLQFFTGTTTQSVVLPVTSTMALGQQFAITNNSTGTVTVKSSGGNTIQAMSSGTLATVTCISQSGTGTSSWSCKYG